MDLEPVVEPAPILNPTEHRITGSDVGSTAEARVHLLKNFISVYNRYMVILVSLLIKLFIHQSL